MRNTLSPPASWNQTEDEPISEDLEEQLFGSRIQPEEESGASSTPSSLKGELELELELPNDSASPPPTLEPDSPQAVLGGAENNVQADQPQKPIPAAKTRIEQLRAINAKQLTDALESLQEARANAERSGLVMVLTENDGLDDVLRVIWPAMPDTVSKGKQIDLDMDTDIRRHIIAEQKDLAKVLDNVFGKRWRPAATRSANAAEKPDKAPDPFHYYSGGTTSFVPVFEGLKRALAYRTLNHTHKLVLLDMLGKFNRTAHTNQAGLFTDGMPYTYSVCDEDVSECAFKNALKAIVSHGFFRVKPGYCPESGQPKHYIPSTAWTNYRPTQAELGRLKKRVSSKERRIESNANGLAGNR
jgi:hypothetical protein